MSQVVIQVENLSKQYLIGRQKEGYKTLRDAISHGTKSVLGRMTNAGQAKNNESEFWALKNISFEVNQGDRLGIIGRNGAGKSTLLKILSRITEPTQGKIKLNGRVASLLEVGTGFHPELTGRENIFLNGAILGMTKVEIRQKFDQIVDFAEVEKFLDTPVKRYSSGMYVRLAFAVAAHLEPEILIVDEVLAVGDAKFQQKCLGRMEEVGEEGRTVLFVSHNMSAINRLCQKVIWLDEGQICMQGKTQAVMSQYMTHGSAHKGECIWQSGIANPGIKEFAFQGIRLKNSSQETIGVIDGREPFWVEIEYKILKRISFCRVGFIVRTIDGTIVFTSYDAEQEKYQKAREPGIFINRCKIPGNLLNQGRYCLSINSGIYGIKNLAYLENILSFDIENIDEFSHVGGKKQGIISPEICWSRQEKISN